MINPIRYFYNSSSDDTSSMQEDPDGDYITYDSYLESLAALRKEVRSLQWLVTMLNEKKEFESGE